MKERRCGGIPRVKVSSLLDDGHDEVQVHVADGGVGGASRVVGDVGTVVADDVVVLTEEVHTDHLDGLDVGTVGHLVGDILLLDEGQGVGDAGGGYGARVEGDLSDSCLLIGKK